MESAATRVCREAGARVSENVRVQDMDLPRPDGLNNRRLEIVADGLPLFQRAQLAVDTTLVSVLRRDGVPRWRAATQDGGPPAEGAGLSGAHRSDGPHTTGGPRQRSGRSVVRGNARVPQPAGQGQGQERAPTSAREGSPGVAALMGVSLSLLVCSAAKSFSLSLLEHRSGLGLGSDAPLMITGTCLS